MNSCNSYGREDNSMNMVIKLATSIVESMMHPSVDILTVTHQGAACDAAGIHFVPLIRRTNILVIITMLPSVS